MKSEMDDISDLKTEKERMQDSLEEKDALIALLLAQNEVAKRREKIRGDEEILFVAVPVNDDGYIDKNELKEKILAEESSFECLPPEMANGMNKEAQIEHFMQTVETNEDGKIKREELLNYYF